MPSISPLEVLVVLVVALIVFGPEKLPELARNSARWLGRLRRMAADVRAEFEEGLEIGDEPDDEDEAKTKTKPPTARGSDHPVLKALEGDGRAETDQAPAPDAPEDDASERRSATGDP